MRACLTPVYAGYAVYAGAGLLDIAAVICFHQSQCRHKGALHSVDALGFLLSAAYILVSIDFMIVAYQEKLENGVT